MSPRARRIAVRAASCVLISVVLAGLTAWLEPAGRLGRFEGVASDLGFPRGEADPSVAVVAIDAKALEEVDPSWPWPRSRQAELVRALDAAGARLIVFDIVFATPGPGDDDLAVAITDAGNVVLAATALDTRDDEDKSTSSRSNVRQSVVLPPVESLATAARAVGQTQVITDPNDGVVREVPLVVEDKDGSFVPGLSLAALATDANQSADPILRRPSGVQVAGRAIPTNDHYDLRVSYPPELSKTENSVAVFSAADVLSGDVGTDLEGKVVFVGVTDVSLGDRLSTPAVKGGGLPGVMVQASAFDTMTSHAYLTLSSTFEIAMWVLLVSLIITFAVQFLPGWLAGIVAVATLVAYLVGAMLRVDTGTIMNFAYPLIAIALAVPLSLAVRYFVETRQRRRVDRLFKQYVPEDVAKKLIDDGQVERAAEGQRLDVTAMFCDLRGFTERSSRMEPIQVNEMLAYFYEFSSAIVLKHGGTLMTYIGDEIFVIFGAPLARDDHAAAAVACCKELQERVHELDAVVVPQGFDPLRFGIGLHSGEIVASHTGSHTRRQYTAIGTTVNIAARLTSRGGPGRVVLSEEVRVQIDPPPATVAMAHQQMKGVRSDFVAWTLVLDKDPSGSEDRP